MEENKIIKKYLTLNSIILFMTPFCLEGLMGFNRQMNKEFSYGGKLNNRLYDGHSDSYTDLYNDFESVVFPISVIVVLLLAGIINYTFFKNYISENKFKPVFKFDFLYRIFLMALSAFTIYQFNLTDFWDNNIALYRIMYLLTLILPFLLIYEFVINKGATIFPDLSYRIKEQNIYSDEKKLTSLKNLNIISEEKFSAASQEIKKEKILVEVRNSITYKEFISNLDFAVSKGLLNEKEKQEKLLEKEAELIKEYNQ